MCGPCCPGKPDVKHLKIGGQTVGISGYDEIIACGLSNLDKTDEEQKRLLLDALKKNNYVPHLMEREYLAAIWAEFKPLRAKKRGEIDEQYHGIPREEIKWFPKIDYEKCSGCGVCFRFCKRGVYSYDKVLKVENPYRCVVSCTGCMTQCEEDAISFPTLVELRDELKILRKKYQSSKE
jgi:NAD-dependent dihydropyrimidine dehydrogenase PreA subunit